MIFLASSSKARTAKHTLGYFGFELKKTWQQALVNALAFLLCFNLPLLITLSDRLEYLVRAEFAPGVKPISIPEYLTNYFASAGGILLMLIAAATAIFAGICTMQYLNHRPGVQFYHALPIRRHTLFLTEAATKAIHWILPFVANFLLSFLICASFGGITNETFLLLGRLYLQAIAVFAAFYGCSALASVLCGTTIMRVILLLWGLLVVPAVVAELVWFAGIFVSKTHMTDAFSMSVLRLLSPVTRFFSENPSLLKVGDVVYFLVVAVLTMAAAVFFYRVRRSEDTGKMIVFPRLASIVKYSSMLVATLLFGLVLYEIEGEMWMIVGFAIGAFVSFMLLNVILERSAKAIFRGLRGFFIFAVCFVVLLVGVIAGATALDSMEFPADMTEKIEIVSGSAELVLVEKEDIETFLRLTESYEKTARSEDQSASYSSIPKAYLYEPSDKRYVDIAIHATFGLYRHRTYCLTAENGNEVLAFLEKKMQSIVPNFEAENYHFNLTIPAVFGLNYYGDSFHNLSGDEAKSLVQSLQCSQGNVPDEPVAYLSVYRIKSTVAETNENFAYQCVFPIYEGDATLLNAYFTDSWHFDDSEEKLSTKDALLTVHARMLDAITGVQIVLEETSEVVYETEVPAEIEEIYDSVSLSGITYIPSFEPIPTPLGGYRVVFRCKAPEGYLADGKTYIIPTFFHTIPELLSNSVLHTDK